MKMQQVDSSYTSEKFGSEFVGTHIELFESFYTIYQKILREDVVILRTTVDSKIKTLSYRCDVCDSKIIGIRYRCLECQDFDVCSDCQNRQKTVQPHLATHKTETHDESNMQLSIQ